MNRIVVLLLATLGAAACASAHSRGTFEGSGSLVGVSVEVAGQPAPLYPAPDGSGRYYLEAREGSKYLVRLTNKTAQRLGVVLTVDGLNVISGTRDQGRGRMYILDPWGQATVQGWRTSLEEVRRFTFVDEKASYAARSGKANSKMGWIEASVYREHRPFLQSQMDEDAGRRHGDREEAADRPAARSGAEAEAAPPVAAMPPAESAARDQKRARSYPGTGWGSRTRDRVVVVDFHAAHSSAERVTLRYEYRPALVALGVLPSTHAHHDRLWQRDQGQGGFAEPPRW